ncbi:MAG: hypothetical protein JW976_07160 [Syntrophaceae bacterium]|nr:hypothetical protein [Syntrophaceae bacterium]
MKSFFNIAINLIAFTLISYLAIIQKWSLQEFCWCVWLAGLFYSWACVITAVFQIMLTARTQRDYYNLEVPLLKKISPGVFAVGIIPVILLVGFIALYIYTWIFFFYGLFLSVFAEMQPVNLFGRNGFINSDFFTPVTYLAQKFWPMIVVTLIANADDFLRKNPWQKIVFPFKTNEILRIHLMILLMPFLMLITWALFKDAYQQLTIVLLIGIFYLIPKKRHGKDIIVNGSSANKSRV